MKNTVRELTEVLALIEEAKRLQEEANNATIACFNYLEMHTELPLHKYGTDSSVYINLFEAIKGFITGDHEAVSQLEIITKDIKDAMDIEDGGSNMRGSIGVHAAHCCKWHGCKYGDDDCPVVTGEVEQRYLCEDCNYALENEEYYKRVTREIAEIKEWQAARKK